MLPAFAQARVRIVVLLVSIPMLAAPRVSAQEVATSFEQLRSVLKPGATVQVTDANGRKTVGKLGELTASSLELLVRKAGSAGRDALVPQARLSERDVRAIALERRDSLLNGTLIGLAAGAGPGMLFIAGRSGGSDPLSGAAHPGMVAFNIVAIPAAIGAGIGALIDASILDWMPVYLTPGQRSSRLRLSPLLSKSAAGVQMLVRF